MMNNIVVNICDVSLHMTFVEWQSFARTPLDVDTHNVFIWNSLVSIQPKTMISIQNELYPQKNNKFI